MKSWLNSLLKMKKMLKKSKQYNSDIIPCDILYVARDYVLYLDYYDKMNFLFYDKSLNKGNFGGKVSMKGKRKIMRNRFNKGFSLVEVLLAIVILGLVATPILQMFITSAQINLRSRELMAATDVSTALMEYMNGSKFDGDTGIKKVFTDSTITNKIPSLSYSTAETADNVTDMGSISSSSAKTFASAVATSRTNRAASSENVVGQDVYWGTNGNHVGVALQNVEYNGYKFDVVIWFNYQGTAGDTYYTYDIEMIVYSTETETVFDASGVPSEVESSHFENELITMNGSIANL